MTDPNDAIKEVLEDRKRRRREFATEMKPLKKYKTRIKNRLQEGRTWPIDAATGERADIDHDDVMAPLPDDLVTPIGNVDEKMQALRAEADKHLSFDGMTVPIDEGVLSRRRRERQEERTRAESVHGETWTPKLVEARLEEAYRTLFRSSVANVRPREFGNAMPHIVREVSDLVHQAGNKSLRNAILHRFKGVPTTQEIRRADDALAWVMTYLKDEHHDLAGFASLWAMWSAWGAKINRKCESIGVSRQAFYRDRNEAIKLIVEGLKRDGKAPT